MKIQYFIIFIVRTCMAVLPCQADSEARPPNILFIAVDDMNNDLGVYGDPLVQTPQLDRLAQRGIRFDRAYCQVPLCGPSRASVMTGLRPNTSGLIRPHDDIREILPDVETLGQFFRKQGYYVARIGKIYHYNNPRDIGTNGDDDAATWQERFNPIGIDRTQEENIVRYPGGRTGEKGRLGVAMAWWDPVSEDEEHTDGMVATKAIELIEEHRDEPFFIAAGFFNPHCPYVAPRKYFDLYPMDQITMEPFDVARRDLEDVPEMAISYDLEGEIYYLDCTLEEARKCKQAYYACISFVDAQIGRMLDALEENDLLDNTIIVFWSDHGYFLGEKGLWYKRKNFERSVKAPLIIAVPGLEQDESSEAIVELLDIYPTLVDLAGYTVPSHLDGKSLRPFLQDSSETWDKPALTQVFRSDDAQGYSVRTDRWRYTEWLGEGGADAGRELYDHENDPEEITNLAMDPGYTETIKEMKRMLDPYASTYSKLRR